MKKLLCLALTVCLLGVGVSAVSCTGSDTPADTSAATETENAGTVADSETVPATAEETVPDAATEPVTEPASAPVTEQETQPETEPATEPATEPETEWDESTYLPVIRFVVCSDVHMSNAATTEAQRFTKLFQSAYAYSESQTYSKLDAVIVVGDMTNEGRADELKAFQSVINKNAKDETQVITVMGNHEYMNAGPAVYKANLDGNLNKHIVINGFHFIGISPGEQG